MSYYLGGYYLIKKKPITFGSQHSKLSYTGSNCINHSLLDHWSYSFTTDNNGYIEEIRETYQLSDETVNAIRDWTEKTLTTKQIGWINLFKDLAAAREYKDLFFYHLPDIHIIGAYFRAEEIDGLVLEFQPEEENFNFLGLYETLTKKIPEVESNHETVLGYDLIGIELDGGFHSFHCHDLANTLAEKFNTRLNEFGLLEGDPNWTAVFDHMNDEENGYEPVPWFTCKMKLVAE